MGAKQEVSGGIANIHRANTRSLVLFGAIHQARTANPDTPVQQTVKSVLSTFSLSEEVARAVERDYYRTLDLFLDNGGL